MKKLIMLVTLFLFTSCTQTLSENIIGEWQATDSDSEASLEILDETLKLIFEDTTIEGPYYFKEFNDNYGIIFISSPSNFEGTLGLFTELDINGNIVLYDNDIFIERSLSFISANFELYLEYLGIDNFLNLEGRISDDEANEALGNYLKDADNMITFEAK